MKQNPNVDQASIHHAQQLSAEQQPGVTAQLIQALADSERRFNALVQDGSDLIAILDPNGNYQYVGPSTKTVLNIEAHHFIGKNAFDFIHPEDKQETMLSFSRLQQEKQVKFSPFRFQHGDGSFKWIETVVSNMLDDPAIGGIVVNSRDITERVESEMRTEESINRFNTVSKATSDAIWDLDIESGEMIWNKGIIGIFGHRNISYTKDWWQSHIHPDDLAMVRNEFNLLIKNEQSRIKTEYRFRCSDGHYKSVLDRAFIIFDQNGSPARIIGSMQDITERVNYVKAMEEQNSRLNEILWIQSHEVRAPLARIMGLVKLLDHPDTDRKTTKEFLKYLNSSAEELDNVISNMLKRNS